MKLLQTIRNFYYKFQAIIKEKYEINEIFELKYTTPTFKSNIIVNNVLITQRNITVKGHVQTQAKNKAVKNDRITQYANLKY